MNNEEEENKKFEAVCCIVLTFVAILWALVFKKLPDDLFWYAILAEGLLALTFYGVLMNIDPKQQTEQKVYHITPEQRTIEQERVLKAEVARLKVRDDAKKVEREKLARLLDEL